MRKKNCAQMKESIKNIKSRDELSENARDIRENSGNAQILKNHFLILSV